MFANRMDRTVWKCGWREIGGYKKYYRSRWEANYARYLEHMRLDGKILSWAHEPTTFWFEGIKRGVNNYLPDFQVIFPDGKEEYHEVKGWMDTKSATKIKRMRIYHPTVCLVIIDKPIYMKLEKEFCNVISEWEMLKDSKNTKEEQPQDGDCDNKAEMQLLPGKAEKKTKTKTKVANPKKKKQPEIDPSLEDESE